MTSINWSQYLDLIKDIKPGMSLGVFIRSGNKHVEVRIKLLLLISYKH
jgi:hypothetical protein